MIDVPQESKLETAKTAAELYGELLGYYGRVLRVQSVGIEYNIDRFHYGFEERDYQSYVSSMRKAVRPQDHFGRLIGARLHESSGWIGEDDEPSGFSGTLSIMLEGQDTLVLNELQKDRILLFQEDAHQWVPIFRGPEWREVQR